MVVLETESVYKKKVLNELYGLSDKTLKTFGAMIGVWQTRFCLSEIKYNFSKKVKIDHRCFAFFCLMNLRYDNVWLPS